MSSSHLPSIQSLPETYIMRVAEISTAHITKEDGARLIAAGPEVLAVIEEGSGHIVHIGDRDAAEINADFSAYSPEFRYLIYSLMENGFSYVRLDADGCICRHLPTFDW